MQVNNSISKSEYNLRINDPQYVTSAKFCVRMGDEFVEVGKEIFDEYQGFGLEVKASYFSAKKVSPIANSAQDPKLPLEIQKMIMGHLSPFDKNRIKVVCSAFSIEDPLFESDENKLAREIALENLEMLRPNVENTVSSNETCNSTIPFECIVDGQGRMIACNGDNSETLIRKENKLEPIQSIKKFPDHDYIELFMARNESGFSEVFSLKVHPGRDNGHNLKRRPENFNKRVFENMIILGNQIWEGANAIAKREKMRELGLAPWEIVFRDPETYPTSKLLEEGKEFKYLRKVRPNRSANRLRKNKNKHV